MVEKIKKSIPWLVILAICSLVIFGVGIVLNEIIADTVVPSVTVGNVALTMGTVILNGGNAITITENTTTIVIGTTTITDGNTYEDIVSVTSTLYLNNTTCGNGLHDANWCYDTIWTICATNTCSGNSCVASCTANVWFIAEPSDASSSYPDQTWKMEIYAVDSGSNTSTASATQELNTASYMDVSSTINYLCGGGNCNPAATSAESNTNATNTGNWEIDIQLSGVDLENSADPTTSLDVIAVGQQKYSTSSDMGDWVGTALSGTPTTLDVVLVKPTATSSNSTESIYWMVKIPDPQKPGAYTGTNTNGVIWSATTSYSE